MADSIRQTDHQKDVEIVTGSLTKLFAFTFNTQGSYSKPTL